jgi:replicative DNA helicase
LPFSEDAERVLLGSVLLDNAILARIRERLVPDDFCVDANRRIASAMVSLEMASKAIDLVTLMDELERSGELEAVGGVSYLSSLTDGMPKLKNFDHWIEIVKEKSDLRSLIKTCETAVARAWQAEVAVEIAGDLAIQVTQLVSARQKAELRKLSILFEETIGSLDSLHERGKRVTGIETGFRQFDDMTRGLQQGDLIVIGARPSMGKTSLGLDIARFAAIQLKKKVGIFSIEMNSQSLMLRMICSEADVDSHKLQTGFASKEDWYKLAIARGRMEEAPIYIDDSARLTPLELRARAARMQATTGCDLLVIDYLQRMSGGSGRYERRDLEVAGISSELKATAKELGVPVLALAQLTRSKDRGEQRPRLEDLRESGQIEQDADLVAFIFREEMVNRTEENRGMAEIIVAKQRNGPTGTIRLAFIPQYTSFRNLPDSFESQLDEGALWQNRHDRTDSGGA